MRMVVAIMVILAVVAIRKLELLVMRELFWGC